MSNSQILYIVLKVLLTIYAIMTFFQDYTRGHFYQRFAYYGIHLTPLFASVFRSVLLVGAAYLFYKFATASIRLLTEFETDTLRLDTLDRVKVFGLRALRYLFILSALAQTGYTLDRLFGLFSLF